MGLFGNSEETNAKNDGIVATSLVLNNELKTVDDDLHFWLKLLVIIELCVLLILIVKFIIKNVKRSARQENLLLSEIRNRSIPENKS